MMRSILSKVAVLSVLAGAASAASAGTVTFEDVPAGMFDTSIVSGGVTFSSTVSGGALYVDAFGENTGSGNALFDVEEATAGIAMDFGGLNDTLSLVFGNDDPSFLDESSFAVLTVFNGLSQVGQTKLQLTGILAPDDLVNATISFSGLVFDRATFRYEDSSGNGLGIGELIDNVSFGLVGTTVAVPVPASVWGGVGLMGLLAAKKLRRR